MNILPLLAEFLGTFLFLTVIIMTGNWLAIGGSLSLIGYYIQNISGGNLNPAVSVAMYLKGSLTGGEMLTFIMSQLLAAVAAVYVTSL